MSNKVDFCVNCGELFEITQRVPDRQKFCSVSCRSIHQYYSDKEKKQFDIGFRCGKLSAQAKQRAARAGRVFEIDREFLEGMWAGQNGKCALSGRSFNLSFADGGPHPDGPSLDRIDSSLGYSKDNVRLVTYAVNTALSNFGEEFLVSLCKDILDNQEKL